MERHLTPEEEKQLVNLLKKTPKFPNASHEVFNELIKIFPSVVVEVNILDHEKSIYLTYREDEHFDGWHTPGGFVGFGESIEETAKRIAKKEVNADIEDIEVVGLLNYDAKADPRGWHLVAVVCTAKSITEPAGGQYFKEIPTEKHLVQLEMIWNLLSKEGKI